MLQDQPTKAPTRKMWAVILATFFVQGALGVADEFMPGMRDFLPAEEWIAALVPILAGYFVRERA